MGFTKVIASLFKLHTKEEIANLASEVKRISTVCEKLNAKINNKDVEIHLQKSEIDAHLRQLTEQTDAIYKQNQEIEKYRGSINLKEEEIRKLTIKLRSLEEDNKVLQSKYNELIKDTNLLELDIREEMNKKILNIKNTLSENQETINRLQLNTSILETENRTYVNVLKHFAIKECNICKGSGKIVTSSVKNYIREKDGPTLYGSESFTSTECKNCKGVGYTKILM